MDDAALLDICRAEGAADARVIDTGKIPFDPKLRSYCAANACGSYGRNYACPPHVGEPDELIARAKSYRRALLKSLQKPSYPQCLLEKFPTEPIPPAHLWQQQLWRLLR